MELNLLTSIISWDFYNRIYNFAAEYGLFYIPLLIFLVQNYLSYLGKDLNTSIASYSIKGMSISVIIYSLMLILAITPMIDLEVVQKAKQGVNTALNRDNNENQYTSEFELSVGIRLKESKISEETIKVPLVWAIVDWGSFALISSIKNILPGVDEKESILDNVVKFKKNSGIKNQTLGKYYNQFYQTCYQGSYSKFDTLVKKGLIDVDEGILDFSGADEETYDWAGASYFLSKKTGKGFYQSCESSDKSVSCYSKHSTTPGGFKMPLIEVIGGKEVNVECARYWNQKLKPAFYKEFNLDKDYQIEDPMVDKMTRLYLIGEEDPNDKPWYEDVGDFYSNLWNDPIGAVKAFAGQVLGAVGSAIAGLVKSIAIYIVKIITPISIAMTHTLMIVFLPIIMLVAAFRFEFLIFYVVLYFSVAFTEIIIIIVSYLHEFVLQITRSTVATHGTQLKADNAMLSAGEAMVGSAFEYFIIDFMMLMLYASAIGLWVQLLMKAAGKGYKAGSEMINDLDVSDSSIDKVKALL